MISSPYISEELKTYLKKFKIEDLVNACVNSIAKEMPQDPYSSIVQTFEKHASQDIQLLGVTASEILSVENTPVLSVHIIIMQISSKVSYLSKTVEVKLPYILGIAGDANMLFDEDRQNGKGQNKGIAFLKKLESAISGKPCSQQEQIDKSLLQEYEANERKGLYQVNICSYLPSLIKSHLLNKPLYSCFAELAGQTVNEPIEINAVVNCLQGSKLVGSKCKPFKFLLIGERVSDPYQISLIVQAIRKTITSGKGGEAALKLHSDGTFICPADTIADNLKIVEDAIVSTNNKDKFSVGISWMADNFYVPEQKKYELENPKALLDTDQLIDYYFKLATDKPIITYFQDPVVCDDQAAWIKVTAKFKDSKVRIGSRKLYATVEAIKKYALQVSKEDMPGSDEAAIADLNSKRIHLGVHYYKAFELQTLSKLLAIKKSLKPVKVPNADNQTILVLGDNNYETHDTSLVDLCVGLGAYVGLGTVVRFDRINKLNRMRELLR